MRVLLIDDDPVQRKMVRAWVEPIGLDVETVDGVIDGLQALVKDDLTAFCLVDWHMLPLSGLSFVGAVRAEDRYANLPIYMLTADDERSSVQRAAKMGVNGYILKPLRHSVLSEKLAEHDLVQIVDGTPERHPRFGVPVDMPARPSTRLNVVVDADESAD